jgi:hypothetical protein
MGQVCGTGEVRKGLWWGDLRERGHFEDLDVERKVILKCSRNRIGGLDWIDLA